MDNSVKEVARNVNKELHTQAQRAAVWPPLVYNYSEFFTLVIVAFSLSLLILKFTMSGMQ